MSPAGEVRCAIYTRKSSEEGLDQSFNSLDAQREACEAFIQSQRQEGWRLISTRYDDGGYSGGTMERPALKRLLLDVEQNKVKVIVVYKVDRLTRSLADFAKIVEALDAKGVSFVSVTQQFNTTTSMGRLTLNVLLSFAQFEREVTGERIRDKIAASKKKGMWMGGLVPLGYDLKERKLVPNKREAALVCKIFSLYLELGSVSELAAKLARDNVKSKLWITQSGSRIGGKAFARGALYDLLRNRLYVGEVRHRETWYRGEHEGIVPTDLWKRVQVQLSSHIRRHKSRIRGRASSSLLTERIHDAAGNRLTPSFTIKKGRRYRYYVSQLAIGHPGECHRDALRVPAAELESVVCGRLRRFLGSDSEIFDNIGCKSDRPALIRPMITRARNLAETWLSLGSWELMGILDTLAVDVVLHDTHVEIAVSKTRLRLFLQNAAPGGDSKEGGMLASADDLIRLTVKAKLKRCGGEVHLVVPGGYENVQEATPRPPLLKALARANRWYEQVLAGKTGDLRSLARFSGLTERYVGKVYPCAFLAPDIVEAILDGRQPRDLTFAKLTKDLPMSWSEQRKQLGFSSPCQA